MEIPHGTESGYGYHFCRCELCRKANSESQRVRRARNKEKRRQETGGAK